MDVTTYTVGPLESNCYLLKSKGEAVLIDPGWELPGLADELGGARLKYIIATHAHLDHIFAAPQVKQACGGEFCLGKDDMVCLEGLADQAAHIGYPEPQAIKVEWQLAAGDELAFGEEKLKVLETPGHTPGHISLLGSAGAFVGDVLFAGSVGRTDFPLSDTEQLMASIRDKLLTLPDDTVVFSGHGEATSIGVERETNPFLRNL